MTTKTFTAIATAFACATLATTTLAAQEQAPRPQAPTTYEGYVLNSWKGLHNKILTMAKDFPEDKYSWRPHPDSRTVLDEFRHVVIGLEMSAAELRGEKFDYAGRLKADEAKPKTRESIVKEMEAAIEASYKLVESSPKPRLVWWLEHQANTMANSSRTIGRTDWCLRSADRARKRSHPQDDVSGLDHGPRR